MDSQKDWKKPKPAAKTRRPAFRRPRANKTPQVPQSERHGLMRLNKVIATSGFTSRRKADFLIETGNVRVNGKVIQELGTLVNPETDEIVVKNQPLRLEKEKIYLAFNKPPQVLTTLSDPEGRPTVTDYLKKFPVRLFPVGRLDWSSEGLLLLTNDGDMSQKISHPKFQVAKTYLVKVDGMPTNEELDRLLSGVTIIGGRVNALHWERMESRGSDKYRWIKVIIGEGKNRQVRKMFEKIGFGVIKLQRVAIGSLRLGNLEKGGFRMLTPSEVEKVFVLPKEIREEKPFVKQQVMKKPHLPR
jgi:23S rRNA pseudouridine2605 synthase